MSNIEILKNRLNEYTQNMEQARDAGEYAMFVKWEVEVENIEKMIEVVNGWDAKTS